MTIQRSSVGQSNNIACSMELIYLVISIVGVAIAGMEVVLSFQRVFCADSSLSTGDRQVLQAKLPVPLCITKNCVILCLCIIHVDMHCFCGTMLPMPFFYVDWLTIKSGEEDSLTAIHVMVTFANSVCLFEPVRLKG